MVRSCASLFWTGKKDDRVAIVQNEIQRKIRRCRYDVRTCYHREKPFVKIQLAIHLH